jgi:predicted DNA-binding protein with PD1-like motif
MLIGAWSLFQGTGNKTADDNAAYISPAFTIEKGKAPGMTWKLLSDSKGEKEYAIVFAKEDEVLSGLTDFAAQQHIVSARFTGIGALKDGTLGYLDTKRNQYKPYTFHQQVELVSMVGDVALYNGTPVVHAHCGVALPDGSLKGGHLIKAVTYPTVEVFMTAFATPLQKAMDKETGLKLINPELK